MRHISIFAFITYLVSLSVNAEYKSYNGYTVERIIPKTRSQLNYLRHLEQTENELDFWTSPSQIGESVDIMFPPHLKDQFSSLFRMRSMSQTAFIKDVGALILEQKRAPRVQQQTGFTREAIPGFWDDYQPLEVVYQFIDAIVAQNPLIATKEVIGKSYQNQDITVLRIGLNSTGHKPIIFMDSAIHAREWITVSTTTYFIQYLADQYSNGNQTIVELLGHYYFMFVPVLNPDGYQYSFTNDRLWRKTRAPAFNNYCVGTDPNRNFDHRWMVAGASSDPCSQTYGGIYANNQLEVKELQDYIISIDPVVYLAVHSYSQVLLYPWGNTTDPPPTADQLLAKGLNATNALTAVNGTQYRVGSTASLLYLASGNAADFAYENGGATYSYTLELRDTGYYGFLLPKDQIVPTGIETNAFFIKLAQDVFYESRFIKSRRNVKRAKVIHK